MKALRIRLIAFALSSPLLLCGKKTELVSEVLGGNAR